MKHIEAAKQKLRKVLEAGKGIAVLKWPGGQHSQATLKYPKSVVKFFPADDPIKFIGEHYGALVFISKKKGDASALAQPHLVLIELDSYDSIKEVLASLENLIMAPRGKAAAAAGQTDQSAGEASDAESAAAQPPAAYPPQSQGTPKEVRQMTEIERFNLEFTALVDLHGTQLKGHEERFVSMRVFAAMLKEFNEQASKKYTPQMMLTLEWIVGVKDEGKNKIGWYKAGSELSKIASALPVAPAETEPADPYERAKWWVAREEVIAQAKVQVEQDYQVKLDALNRDRDASLAELDNQLKKVGKAKAALANLADL